MTLQVDQRQNTPPQAAGGRVRWRLLKKLAQLRRVPGRTMKFRKDF